MARGRERGGRSLDRLRHRIQRLDEAVLALVAERMELARDIGEAKLRAGIPLRDFAVEKQVLERAEAQAAELGLASDLARAVMQQLIEESCRVQEEERLPGPRGGEETVLIVGGGGKMGRWLARFFVNQGHRVRVFDPAGAPDDCVASPTLEEGLAGATLALVAVPLAEVGRAIRLVAEIGFAGTLFDVASLKSHLGDDFAWARERGLSVASVHPMFGPSARLLSDKVICLCDCGDAAATERVGALFADTAATIVRMTLEEHDRAAAYLLGLSHFVNLLFARALAGSGRSAAELTAIGSTTFRAQLATTASVLHEDPDLYFAIQRLNPFSAEVYGELRQALADWTGWVGQGDRAAFSAAMAEARAWLDREPRSAAF